MAAGVLSAVAEYWMQELKKELRDRYCCKLPFTNRSSLFYSFHNAKLFPTRNSTQRDIKSRTQIVFQFEYIKHGARCMVQSQSDRSRWNVDRLVKFYHCIQWNYCLWQSSCAMYSALGTDDGRQCEWNRLQNSNFFCPFTFHIELSSKTIPIKSSHRRFQYFLDSKHLDMEYWTFSFLWSQITG